jgi:hypothetical protein
MKNKTTTIYIRNKIFEIIFIMIKSIMKYKVKKKRPTWPKIGTLYKNSTIIPCFPIKYVLNPIDDNIPFPNTQLTESQLEEYFEPVKEKPMSWEELDIDWYYVTNVWSIFQWWDNKEYKLENKSTRPTKEMAEAQLALSQLMQLRDAWRDWWNPVFEQDDFWYVDSLRDCYRNKIKIYSLSFPTKEICDLFEETFKDLIDKIKPLYFS